MADQVCVLILSSDLSAIDIEIEKNKVREQCRELHPDREELSTKAASNASGIKSEANRRRHNTPGPTGVALSFRLHGEHSDAGRILVHIITAKEVGDLPMQICIAKAR